MKRLYILSSIVMFLFLLNCQPAVEKAEKDKTLKWINEFKLSASDPAEGDYFGKSVSISGDYAIAGADYEDGAGTMRGAAYIFHKTGTNSWDAGIKIAASDSAENDCFGKSVAVSGDRMMVGAYMKDGTGADSGSAYIYKLLIP